MIFQQLALGAQRHSLVIGVLNRDNRGKRFSRLKRRPELLLLLWRIPKAVLTAF